MKTFNEFVGRTRGTFVSIRFTDKTNQLLKNYTIGLGLNPIDDFHATVVYSPENLRLELKEIPFGGSAAVTSIQYLGEIDSEYRAIILNIQSKELQDLFDFYVREHNYKPTHDDFIQHVSLAYAPEENVNLNNLILPNFKLEFKFQKIEVLIK